MVVSSRCADASLAADEPLPGTGIVAQRWLCVESRRAWGHDAIATAYPEPVADWLAELDAKVLAIRRPGHTGAVTVFAAESTQGATSLRRLELDRVEELPGRDPWSEGELLDGLLLLVCAHGRRDACCSRLGIPVFRALEAVAGRDRVWQCSHTGGHRFAANVVGLPSGVTFGRVEPNDAPTLVALLQDGRVPLGRYRGRSVYEASVQAAEVTVRQSRRLDRLDDLRLEAVVGEAVTFVTADDERIVATVALEEGPLLAKSCGAEPERVGSYGVLLTP